MARPGQTITPEEQARLTRLGRLRARARRQRSSRPRTGVRYLCPTCNRQLRPAERDLYRNREENERYLGAARVHYQCSRGHRITRTFREVEQQLAAAENAGLDSVVL